MYEYITNITSYGNDTFESLFNTTTNTTASAEGSSNVSKILVPTAIALLGTAAVLGTMVSRRIKRWIQGSSDIETYDISPGNDESGNLVEIRSENNDESQNRTKYSNGYTYRGLRVILESTSSNEDVSQPNTSEVQHTNTQESLYRNYVVSNHGTEDIDDEQAFSLSDVRLVFPSINNKQAHN
ncbi:hypothetical protein EDL79_04050 [Ehrlichia ruminantium]|uniref:Uncharacterized protein n=1 Tax=Ehrlichia ruminantium TaxID=779 RepID=A0AAE6QAH4_EHRRU|nr:hypothetical protein [Ehrlichia ruminantium]QGR02787.1 hypothetical protein EDL81_04040 [Ehrlichia ruminantium]QGR03709.1 hypothetical protein EDL80_04040 [Ehrlichia ruminantium]QGR04636.1 hypothetical protein EDL79_04050 [Ehrlichia ruminantium]